MTESEIIDEILWTIKESGNSILQQNVDNRKLSHARRKILSYALTEKTCKTNLVLGNYEILTERGHQVLEADGFDNWRANNEKYENERHQAAINSAQATVDAAKSAKKSLQVALFSGIVATLAFVLSFYQTWKGHELDKEINVIKNQVKITDSLMQARLPKQIPIVLPKEAKKTK